MKQTRTKRLVIDTPMARRAETSPLSHLALLAEAVVKTSVRYVAHRGQVSQHAARCFMLTERDIAADVYNFLP
jgi:hypothetical protein